MTNVDDDELLNQTRPRQFTYAQREDKRMKNHIQNQLDEEAEYKKMQTFHNQEPKSQSTDKSNTQSPISETTTIQSSTDPLHQSNTIDHTEASGYNTQNSSNPMSSSQLQDHSTTDPPFNIYTPFLTLGGLVIVALIVYALIKYYYNTSINENETQEREPEDSQNTTTDTIYSKTESTDTLDFTSNTTIKTTRSSSGFLFESTTDIESMTEAKLMTNRKHKFYVNDTIKILTSFYTDTQNCRPLPKGMRLRVVQVDNNGDLKVRHNSWKSNSWIFQNNYYKIQKI